MKFGQPIYTPAKPGQPEHMTKVYRQKLTPVLNVFEQDATELAAQGWYLTFCSQEGFFIIATYQR